MKFPFDSAVPFTERMPGIPFPEIIGSPRTEVGSVQSLDRLLRQFGEDRPSH